MLGLPFVASATPGRVARPAPLLGQHTREVLEELGLPEAGAGQIRPDG
jgi:crotonobetainyl-CoA:carnitine CoA-transferase CaiB-like acyl-CoA transferase